LKKTPTFAPSKIILNNEKKMQVIENARIVCRSIGENNVIIVENENTGQTISLQNPKGLVLDLGLEGRIIFKDEPVMQLLSFEPVMEEELV
jgi:hypothetical protein